MLGVTLLWKGVLMALCSFCVNCVCMTLRGKVMIFVWQVDYCVGLFLGAMLPVTGRSSCCAIVYVTLYEERYKLVWRNGT